MRSVVAAMIWMLADMCSQAAVAADPRAPLDLAVLNATTDATVTAVTGGALDAAFRPLATVAGSSDAAPRWLRVRVVEPWSGHGVPALSVRTTRGADVDVYAPDGGTPTRLARATALPEFRGMQTQVFLLPPPLGPGQALYVRIAGHGEFLASPSAGVNSFEHVLTRGASHARMIALAFGALAAVALSALLIWFVLVDRVFLLYAALFSLQALYIAYLSGQGFDWPLLAWARPIGSHAWNVPAACSGAVACLFVREIADLQRFSPRVYAAFGWLAGAFVVLAVGNAAKFLGLAALVSGIGNVLFLGTAIFTLVVALAAWRRGIRAAGWFLIAWGLLEAFTIATAAQLLVADTADAERLLYYWLPLSMVAAAVLIALGVADRLREQRRALSVAQRHAQTDALTGVLNRRSLVERLEAACQRARARDLPISLLFIDLDHFKEINDSRGHAAGDACLRAVVGPIQSELRQSDVVGRYGGEEFVVILSSADTAAAEPIAQRILERVANIRVDGFGAPIRLTCSIGVAGSDALGVWGEQLIARADTAVYAAKNAGRNRVQTAAAMAA